jgi:hypothetical protein
MADHGKCTTVFDEKVALPAFLPQNQASKHQSQEILWKCRPEFSIKAE